MVFSYSNREICVHPSEPINVVDQKVDSSN